MKIFQKSASHIQGRFLLLMAAILIINAGMFFILSFLSAQRLEYALFQRDLINLEGRWRGVAQAAAMLPASSHPPSICYKIGMDQISELKQKINQMKRVAQQAEWLDSDLRSDLDNLLHSIDRAIQELESPYADLSEFIRFHKSNGDVLLQRPTVELIRMNWLRKEEESDPERLFHLVRMYNHIAQYDASFSSTLESRMADIRRRLDVVITAKFRAFELFQFSLGVTLSGLVMLLSKKIIVLYNESVAARAFLADLSIKDVLTELPNRRGLISLYPDYVERSKEHDSGLFLMLLDVDDFKNVNDSLGHAAGDALLRTIAQRMKNATRSPSVPIRLGGDEFVLLLPDTDRAEDAEVVANRLLTSISAPISHEGHLLSFTISIGIAQLSSHQESLDELLQQADMALYEAKKKGKNTYALHNKVRPAELMEFRT